LIYSVVMSQSSILRPNRPRAFCAGFTKRRVSFILNRTEKSNVGTNRSKGECIRPGTPLSLEDARRLVQGYVEHYNNVRLNSAIGYITPKDMLAGRQQELHADRDRKLEAARKQRQVRRQLAA
jgi:integrase-like protein